MAALSESTRKVDRTCKVPTYAKAGVRHVWLVEAGEPFDAIELELGVLSVVALRK